MKIDITDRLEYLPAFCHYAYITARMSIPRTPSHFSSRALIFLCSCNSPFYVSLFSTAKCFELTSPFRGPCIVIYSYNKTDEMH